MQIEHRFADTNGIRLHVAECGPEDAPLLLLLHGFPEFWYAWRHHLPRLAAAGYRVVAPDLRGYNLSDRPAAVADYGLDALGRDVVGLMDAYGRDKACVAGHDWGGAVTWRVADAHAERVIGAAVINCPHADVLRRVALTQPRQLLRSWYILWFQLPWLADQMLARRSFDKLIGAMVGTAAPHTFSDEDLAAYRAAWGQPGAMTAMLNWYRAALRHPAPRPQRDRITVPLHLIWGDADHALGFELTGPSLAMCDDGRLDRVAGASHWVHLEQVDRVCDSLTGFFDSLQI